MAEHDFKVGDLVTRDGTDVQRVTRADSGDNIIDVLCLKAPSSGWASVGDVENGNLACRYKPWTGDPSELGS